MIGFDMPCCRRVFKLTYVLYWITVWCDAGFKSVMWHSENMEFQLLARANLNMPNNFASISHVQKINIFLSSMYTSIPNRFG